ncbi:MAG: transglycosylase SLT domain-containing protein [Pseudorhodobacter sp.]
MTLPRTPFLIPFCILLWLAWLPMPAATQTDPATMRAALAATAQKDWDKARSLIPEGVGRDIIDWQYLRAGEGLLGDYETFLKHHSDWPGLPYLQRRGEVAVARSTTPTRVIAYFDQTKPATGQGAIALIGALMAQGRNDEAGAEARRAWVGLELSAAEENRLLELQGPALAVAHEARTDALLWDGRRAEAQRMLPRLSLDWQALTRARLALRAESPGVDDLIAAVPETLRDHPGLAYERFVWRMRKGLTDSALVLLLQHSQSATTLGHPAEWARRRAQLVRDLLAQGRGEEAYRAAAGHRLISGGAFADLEFLAGWIALRRLKDPETALGHFRRLAQGVSTPISLSRALYWQGRTAEAAGDKTAARAAYGEAARHQTAYYGLLAAEKLGLNLDPGLLSETRPPDWQSAEFASSPVLEAARLLLRTGERGLAKRFILHMADDLNATEIDQLADLTLTMGEPHFAVLIGKKAAARGIILPRAYFPVPDLIPDDLPVTRAFALSIARRESEFDPAVISPAGARGLMQVMPGTARMMATETGQSYSRARLTEDPAYNVSLGAAYLAGLVTEFGPSVALVASGYNAGPGRPRRWVQEFGDPRNAAVDVVDWVETIPFSETRTYVMRVVESLIIYRAKLRGQSGPVQVISELTGR